jgi:hypothetical protein
LKTDGLNWHTALFILGAAITACSFLSLTVKPSEEHEPRRRLESRHEPDVAPAEPIGAVA